MKYPNEIMDLHEEKSLAENIEFAENELRELLDGDYAEALKAAATDLDLGSFFDFPHMRGSGEVVLNDRLITEASLGLMLEADDASSNGDDETKLVPIKDEHSYSMDAKEKRALNSSSKDFEKGSLPFFKSEEIIEKYTKSDDEKDMKITEDEYDQDDDKDCDSNSSSSDTLSCCDDCCSWDGDDEVQSSETSDEFLIPLENDINDLLKEENDERDFPNLCDNDHREANHTDDFFWGKPDIPDSETCSTSRDMEMAYLQSHTEELEMLLQDGVNNIFNEFDSNSDPIPCFDLTDEDSSMTGEMNSNVDSISTTSISEITTSIPCSKTSINVSKSLETDTAKIISASSLNCGSHSSPSAINEPQITVTTTSKVLDESLPSVRVSDFIPVNGSNIFRSSHPRLEVVQNPFTAAASLSKRIASSNKSFMYPPTPPSCSGSDSESGGLSPLRTAPLYDSLIPHMVNRKAKNRGNSIRMPIKTTLISSQPKGSTGMLNLTEEEKRTLISEGYSIPQKLPLNKSEERSLKKIRRKIKNKISAQESRRKKKEYMDNLEHRVSVLSQENRDCRRRMESLRSKNAQLLREMQKLQAQVNKQEATTTRENPLIATIMP